MSIKTRLATPMPYAAWMAVSAVLLVVAQATDPYVFGFAAFAAAAVSAALVVISLPFGGRALLWAAIASLPTLLSFAVLSTYNWA